MVFDRIRAKIRNLEVESITRLGDDEPVRAEDLEIEDVLRVVDEGQLLFGDDDDWSLDFNEANNRLILEHTAGNKIRFCAANSVVTRFSGGAVKFNGEAIDDIGTVNLNAQDVRNISSPSQGVTAYHDGSGTNTEGLAAHDGTDWISQVDGSTIN